MLRARGARVGVFASLHTYPLPRDAADYAFYAPDPFAHAADAVPAELETFQRLNLTMSRRSVRNVSTAIPWREAMRFAARAPGLGLRAGTAWAAMRQLVGERRRPETRVRRRTFQTVIAFDLFAKLLHRTRPDFSTFFTNHVASAMHRYWAATYPSDYDRMEFDAAWRRMYRGEIDYAMQWFDAFLTRLVRFVGASPGFQLWIASSMGQAATTAQPIESQLDITDLGRFMSALGVGAGEWSQRPAMAPEVSVFVTEERAESVRSSLASLRVAGAPFYHSERDRGFFMISAGHANLPDHVRSAHLDGREVPFETLGVEKVAIEDHSTSSAYHVPEGHLLIYVGARDRTAIHRDRTVIRTIDVAPAILRALGADAPGSMAGEGRRIADAAR